MRRGPVFWAAMAAMVIGVGGMALNVLAPAAPVRVQAPVPVVVTAPVSAVTAEAAAATAQAAPDVLPAAAQGPATPAPASPEPAPSMPVAWPAIAATLALAVAYLAFGKRARGARKNQSVKILSSVPVAQNQRLVAVKFGGRVLLLGQTSTQINILAGTSDPEELKHFEPAVLKDAEKETTAAPQQLPEWLLKPLQSPLRALPLAVFLLLAASAVQAQQLPAPLTIGFETARSPQQTVGALQMLLFMSVLAFVPAIVLMATSFTRIVIVLSLLRQAIGMPQIPPNQVIVALSIFLTLFVMRPQLNQINTEALNPYMKGQITHVQALEKAGAPLRGFMLKQTRAKDLQSFTAMSGIKNATEIPFTVLVPAFLTSELKTAFQIGFLLFIPFLLVDMIVASILMSMGMVMIPPAMISMPFKLLLFVLIDGWNLVLSGLAAGFR